MAISVQFPTKMLPNGKKGDAEPTPIAPGAWQGLCAAGIGRWNLESNDLASQGKFCVYRAAGFREVFAASAVSI